MQKPNIIFFFSDQQRWDTIGAYGQKLPVTPNLDKMASEGVRFEYAFSNQPVCGPARAMLQTGKYPTEINCHTNDRMLPENEKTIANYFSEAGYEVAYIGKWHLASDCEKGINNREKSVPEEYRGGYKDFWLASDVLEFTSHGYGGHMFDADGNKVEWDENTYRADAQTDFVIDYLNNRKTDKPFFLFVSYIEPHHQNDRNRYEGPSGSKENFGGYETPGDLVDTEGDWRENFPDYLGCCNSLDYNFGRMRDELEKLGIAGNTNIIYTSDHGSHFKTRNGEYKRSCHEGCVRIPMLAYGPDFKGGKVCDNIVSLIDIPPTLLSLGAIEKPSHMKGSSIKEAIDSDNWTEDAFIQISETQIGRALRTKKWKYSVSAEGEYNWRDTKESDIYYEEFLYDLENDPHEKNNLVKNDEYASVRESLKKRLLDRIYNAEGKRVEIRRAL